ncbi:MAG: response regulator transcription factor, partial [Actinomycetota bacterium]
HHVRRVVLYTWDVPDAFADELVEAGIDAVILKSTSGADLVDALERVGRDERPDAAGAPARSSLTEREQEVLVMLSEGMSNREIADELYLSVDTVKTHVRKLFRKLGVSNRTQAAMIAVDVGLTRQRLAS